MLVLVAPAWAQSPGFSFSYGPLPDGWGEAAELFESYGEGWWWAFSRTYDTEYDETTRIHSSPHIDVFVIEASYDELQQVMDESYRGHSVTYSGWNLRRLREANAGSYPAGELAITQVGASESRTTLDGRAAVRYLHETEWVNTETEATSRRRQFVSQRRLVVYWMDLGTTGVGLVADLTAYPSHSVGMETLEASAEQLIQTFRFGPPGASPSPEGSEGEAPWEVIIGAGALAGALAAAARRLARRRKSRAPEPQGERRGEDPDEPVGYVLRLSHGRLSLHPERPATLTASAWRVGAEGGYEPAPEAALHIAVPASLAGVVRVAPTEGSGQLVCQVALAEPVGVEPTALAVTAEAPRGRATAEVVVEAEPVYTLEFF